MAIEEELVPSDANEGEVRATAIEVEENEDDDADKTTGVLSDEEREKEEDRLEEEEEAEQQENKGDLAGGNQEKEEDQEERQGEQTEEMTTDSGEHAEEKRGKTEHEQAPPTAPSKKEQKGHRTLTPHASNEEAPPRKMLRVRGDASATMETGRAAATDCAPAEGGASTGGQDQQRVKGARVRPVARVLLGACGPQTHSGASVGPRWEEETEAKLQKLLGERDFAGAAALQEEAKRRAAQEKDEDFEADLARLLARRDYAGAAALQAEADKRAARPTIEAVTRDDAHQVEEMCGTMRADHEAKIKIMLFTKDYARAAALEKQFDDLAAEVEALLKIPDLAGAAKRLEEARGMPWGKPLRKEAASTGVDARVVEKANRAREAAVAARSAATAAETVLEERRQVHEAEIQRFLAKCDYEGAAKYDKEKEDMVEECRSKNQLAYDKESIAASLGTSGLTADADHSAAAQMPRTAPLGHRGPVDQGQAVEAPKLHGVKLSVADLMRTDAPMPAQVLLQGVHVLSYSKVASLPMWKGKSKNKGKSKGKGKDGQGKSGKAGKTENARQDSKAMYVGQDKHVIAIAAFGDDVKQLSESLLGCLVDIDGLRPRAGQGGTLYWSEAARIVKRFDKVDAGGPFVFEYETKAVTQDLATMAHIQDYSKGDFVALVIRPQSVECRYTEAGESFLLVHGYDMNGAATGTLRFWRHEDGDITEGKIYIIRGLKIVDETYWSDDAWKYVPREDGTKTVEVTFRTAFEEVTDVVEVMRYFP